MDRPRGYTLDLRGQKSISLNTPPYWCGYFKNKKALAESFTILEPTQEVLVTLIESGLRHFGAYYWNNKCDNCSQCVSLRIPLKDFVFSKNKKRVIKKNTETRVEIGEPYYTFEKYQLFLKHSKKFPYSGSCTHTIDNFQGMFYEPAHPFVREYCYFSNGQLFGVGYVDETDLLFSSTYFFYDEDYSHLSPGLFSILFEIQRAQEKGAHYYYLGYFLSNSPHMNYKKSFYPNQILYRGNWVPFVDKEGKTPPFNSPLEGHHLPIKFLTDFDLERDFPDIARQAKLDSPPMDPPCKN